MKIKHFFKLHEISTVGNKHILWQTRFNVPGEEETQTLLEKYFKHLQQ